MIAVICLVVLAVFMVSGCEQQAAVLTSEMPQIIQTYGEAEAASGRKEQNTGPMFTGRK
jgi:hypothetical protein